MAQTGPWASPATTPAPTSLNQRLHDRHVALVRGHVQWLVSTLVHRVDVCALGNHLTVGDAKAFDRRWES